MLPNFTRDQLYFRHKLSHQQIDDLFEEKESGKYPESKAQSLSKLNEFLDISRLLSGAGSDFISLKGALLSYRIYNDATYRRYGDIDLLMDFASVEKAIVILEERGYNIVYFSWPLKNRRKKILQRHNNQVVLFNNETGIVVELHWALFKFRLINPETFERIIKSNLIQVRYKDQQFKVFNPEFELLFLIIHGSLHEWIFLKWLLDIRVIIDKNDIDYKKFMQLATALRADRLVALCNSLLEIYFPGKYLPSTQEQRPSDFLISYSLKTIKNDAVFDESVFNSLGNLYFKMKAFRGVKCKISFLKNFLFSEKDIDNKYLPSAGLFFYLYKPIGIVLRKFKQNA